MEASAFHLALMKYGVHESRIVVGTDLHLASVCVQVFEDGTSQIPILWPPDQTVKVENMKYLAGGKFQLQRWGKDSAACSDAKWRGKISSET